MSHKSGFTLIELLVAMFVFSLGVGAALNLFLSGISFQKSASSFEEFSSQTSAFFEYTSRSLRQASKDLSATCLSSQGLNYELFNNSSGIKFMNQKGECQEIFLEAGIVKEKIGAVSAVNLTPENLQVSALVFSLLGAGQQDDIQPRVTFTMTTSQGTLQTTVSQRTLDVLR
ncbi:MAG: hypothetical protein Greene071421_465 [Parcubacteria group bacterium Greene0714_21]|nr:MAG: hypothetical protein Greene041639_118 [Parcubacteria group bacterium Greene0416_39]TSC97445.1 MAG: hypothetical protein Greene101447_489 [Parcubacteria group bacterium Greene1014_47]TSD04099.1 MAG: hypothetical protein Greene071421_465 [Parcubacteria group bacterium Greene0714_21]